MSRTCIGNRMDSDVIYLTNMQEVRELSDQRDNG